MCVHNRVMEDEERRLGPISRSEISIASLTQPNIQSASSSSLSSSSSSSSSSTTLMLTESKSEHSSPTREHRVRSDTVLPLSFMNDVCTSLFLRCPFVLHPLCFVFPFCTFSEFSRFTFVLSCLSLASHLL